MEKSQTSVPKPRLKPTNSSTKTEIKTQPSSNIKTQPWNAKCLDGMQKKTNSVGPKTQKTAKKRNNFGLLVALSWIDEEKGKHGIPFNGFGLQTNMEIPPRWARRSLERTKETSQQKFLPRLVWNLQLRSNRTQRFWWWRTYDFRLQSIGLEDGNLFNSQRSKQKFILRASYPVSFLLRPQPLLPVFLTFSSLLPRQPPPFLIFSLFTADPPYALSCFCSLFLSFATVFKRQ